MCGARRVRSRAEQRQDKMFKAYFDRSELGDPAAVMAVSGYLSSEERWQQFEPSWHRVLESFGVGMFHMTEFESRLGAFRSLNDDARISFIGQLIDLVGRHAFVGIGAAIVLDDYDALEQEERKLLGHPYPSVLDANRPWPSACGSCASLNCRSPSDSFCPRF